MMGEEDDNRMSNISRGNGCSENLVCNLLHSNQIKSNQNIFIPKKEWNVFPKRRSAKPSYCLHYQPKPMKCCAKTPFFCCLIGRHYQKMSDTSSVGQDFKKSFFNLVKLKLSIADEREKQCVIMFDEMQILQSYEYCGRLKQMFNAHKKVQVVLLR